MFRLLIDTCVWLDLAKDHRQGALLEALAALMGTNQISLILPRTIVDEFTRNKARIAEDSGRSLSSALKRAKEIVGKLGEGRGKQLALAHLADVDHRLPQLGEAAIESIGRIEELFARSRIIDVTEQTILRAARRGIDRLAPFHRQRNGIDDAILFEVYLDHLAAKEPRTRYAFVTHNTKDFSHSTADTRLPHPDLAPSFSRIRSVYATNLAELLKRIEPSAVSDAMLEQEWAPEPRRLAEILAALDEFTDKVWYGRHGLLDQDVATGKIKVVDHEEPRGSKRNTISRDIWLGARKAARRVERRYGSKNLGPWSDFEWGMLSGKLSALRWVLGDDWDMLDT